MRLLLSKVATSISGGNLEGKKKSTFEEDAHVHFTVKNDDFLHFRD